MTAPEETVSTDRAPRRGHQLVLLTGAFIFVCGALTGAGVSFLLFENMVAQRFRHPEQMISSMMEDMQSRLDLTPEQRTQVEAILEQKKREMDRIFQEEFRPTMDAHFNSLKEEIASVLTKEQADAWIRDFDQMRHRFGPPPPRPSKDH